ncbi:MAG: glycosyltransferase family 9 protein [Acidobacteriota bacterium]|nr:glycosyltransferase family 9 protein [Acidobacteriota bacterium]
MIQKESILIVRLGAMGDIVHALPAAASLKLSFPDRKLVWVVRPKWMPLLEGNPFIDELVPFDKQGIASIIASCKRVRGIQPTLAFDFQGLIQSALIGRLSRPRQFWGFDKSIAREWPAPLFYTSTGGPSGPHRVERNLQLAQAAGARTLTDKAWLPVGFAEGVLPSGPFVLTSPLAGWVGKQWPLQHYEQLAKLLSKEGVALVANTAVNQAPVLTGLENLHVHASSIPGLLHATRNAVAVVGVDSGPLHMAAALQKPGVAIFGPTDPAANGPYGDSISVLRAGNVTTTYQRHSRIHPSMKEISAEQVFNSLMRSIDRHHTASVQSL